METERRGYSVVVGDDVEGSREIENFYKSLLCAGATIGSSYLEKVDGSDVMFRVTGKGIEYARNRRDRLFANRPEDPTKEDHEAVGFGD